MPRGNRAHSVKHLPPVTASEFRPSACGGFTARRSLLRSSTKLVGGPFVSHCLENKIF